MSDSDYDDYDEYEEYDEYDDIAGGAEPPTAPGNVDEPGDEEPDDDADDIDLEIDNYEKGPESLEHTVEVLIVPDDKRILSDRLSMYEVTELVSVRVAQISKNNDPYIDATGLHDPVDIAKRELAMRRSPLMIKRKRGATVVDGKKYDVYEIWNPNEMIHPADY